MSMVCPQCHGSFSQRLNCPACGVRLEYRESQAPRAAVLSADAAWQHTPWGRILVGLLLAQGLYYGLWHLCKAGLLVVNSEAARGLWATLAGLLVLQGLQAVSLLVGGSLAGAGKRQGLVYGGVVGLVNGLISVLTVRANRDLYTPVLLYGQPLLHTAFGGAGGLLGLLIWRPLSPVSPPVGAAAPAAGAGRARRSPLGGPVAWVRVLTGTVVAVVGALSANAILDFVLEASDGRLTIDSALQAHLVTWEITALAMLLGSAFAGAGMPNGLKQGLCVGTGTAAILLGIRLSGKVIHFDAVALTLASALLLCVLGGWFGGQLFPPLTGYVRRKGLGPASL